MISSVSGIEGVSTSEDTWHTRAPPFASQKKYNLPSFGYVAGPTSGKGEHEKTVCGASVIG